MQSLSPQIDPGRSAVILIECQREWLAPDGKLQAIIQDRAQFDAATAGAAELLGLARQAGLSIAHAGLSFQSGYPELGNTGFGLRGAIQTHATFAAATAASDFAAGFEPKAGEFIVSGRVGSSAFAGSNLDIWLRNNQIETVILAGFALHVCVESTLRAAHDLGYLSYLAQDASAAFTQAQRQYVLSDVLPHFGRSLTNAELVRAVKSTENPNLKAAS